LGLYNDIDMTSSTPAKILLFDSDPQFTYLMKRYVDNCGFRLVLAGQSANIVDLVEKEKPSLIFLNVSRAEVDYSHLFHELRSRPSTSKISIILCSASEVLQQDWMLEADECLIQPIMYTDFIRIVSESGLIVQGEKGCL
jgi:CheY-like chemotaxis protein